MCSYGEQVLILRSGINPRSLKAPAVQARVTGRMIIGS
jgi:hypothetical protein